MALRDIIRKSVGIKENGQSVGDPRQTKIPVHQARQSFNTKQHYAGVPKLADAIARSVGLRPKSRDPRREDCDSIVGADACQVLADKEAGRLTSRTNRPIAGGALVIKSAVDNEVKHFNESLASGEVTASTTLRSAVDQTLRGLVTRSDRTLPGWNIDGAGYGEKTVSGKDAYVIPEGGEFRLVLVDQAGDMLVPIDNQTAIYDTMIGAQEIGERFFAGDDAGAFIEINTAIAELEAASITQRATPKKRTAKEWRKLINRSGQRQKPQSGLIVRAVGGSVDATGRPRGAYSVRSAVLKTLGVHQERQPNNIKLTVREAMRRQDASISVERSAKPQRRIGFECPTSGQVWVNQAAWLASSAYSPDRDR